MSTLLNNLELPCVLYCWKLMAAVFIVLRRLYANDSLWHIFDSQHIIIHDVKSYSLVRLRCTPFDF